MPSSVPRALVRAALAAGVAAAFLHARPLAAEDAPASGEAAAPAGGEVSYYEDVRPILSENCTGCHQPAKSSGRLVLTDYASLQEGGRSADETPTVVPGKPEESLLWLVITPRDGEPPEMPKKADPLGDADRDVIRRWIAQGAGDDTPADAERARYTQDDPPVYELPPVLTSVDFSPDGKLLAVSGYHEVLLHRADGSRLVARLVGLSERIESARFSPGGELLAVTGGSPGRFGEVQVWDVDRRRLRLSRKITYDTVYGGSWSPDGRLIAFGCADDTVRVIEARSGEEVLYQGAHNDWVLGTAFSSDASHLVSVSRDRSLKLIQVETQQFIDNITSITPGALKGGLMSVDRHPQKDQLLVGGADGVPKIYRMYREKARKIGDDFNRIRAFDAMPGRVFSTEFSADGTRVVAGSSSDRTGEVRAWKAEDGTALWKAPLESPVYCVTWSPDGSVVAACGFDGRVRLIDAATGEVRRSFVPVPLSF